MGAVARLLRQAARVVANALRSGRNRYLRLMGVQIGKGTMISMGAKIDSHRGQVIIGERCHVTYGCVILSHDGAAKQMEMEAGDGVVRIGNDVFVGVNSVVLANVTIGDGSIIGAGSVVTRDVPPHSVAVGNPARIVRCLRQE